MRVEEVSGRRPQRRALACCHIIGAKFLPRKTASGALVVVSKYKSED